MGRGARAVERTYHVAPLMARADERLSQWPAERRWPARAARSPKDMNALFAFEKLRPMADADMAAEQAQADFPRTCRPRSCPS